MNDAPAVIVERTRELVARRRRIRGLALAAAAAPVLGLAVVALDASAGLPAWARLLLTGVVVLASIGVGALLLVVWRWLAPDARSARAQAEAALGDAHRHLTAAIELAAMPGPLAARAAGDFAAGLDVAQLAPRLPPARVGGFLLLGLAAAVLAGLMHLVQPSLLPAVLPRLADPFGDHPPWSATTLHWIEAPPRVRPPVAPRLVVRAEGPAPRELVLVGRDAGGAAVVRVVMLAIGGDQWAATLAPITGATLGASASPWTLWAEGAGTRTFLHRLDLDPVPFVTGGAVVHTSPDYSRLAQRSHALGVAPPDIAALPGSRLVVAPTANRPLAGITLLRDGTRMAEGPGPALTLDDPQPGRWTVRLEAEDGIVSDELPLFNLARREDQPPTVRFEQPASDGVATPDMAIPLHLVAEDDLGLVRLTRYRLRNGQRETEGREGLGGTSDAWRGALRTDGARPGDVLRLGAVATDGRPPEGQFSAPAERTIHIISHGDYNALVMERIDQHALEQKYGDLLERIARLEAELAASAPAGEGPDAQAARLQQLAERAAALRAEVTALRRPEPLFAIEPELQQELEQHLAGLERAAREGRPPPDAGVAKRLRDELAALTAEAEAQALREQLRDLAAAQRTVAQELAELQRQGVDDDAERARLREASARQLEMERALKDWQEAAGMVQERLARHRPEDAAKLGELAQAVQKSEVERLVAQACRSGRAGRVGDACRDGEEAARRLTALAGSAGEGSAGEADQAKGRCRSQLCGLAKRGFNPSSSQSSSGGGATGASGGGMMVRRGGDPRGGQPLQLFGPEALTALAGNRAGGRQQSGAQAGTSAAEAGRPNAATPYATGVRTTTAGVGASFSPGEELLIEDYFRRLDGDALQPTRAAPGRQPDRNAGP
jgi:hypothetical protein